MIGYYAPHEGSSTLAYGIYNVESLADYKAYRANLADDPHGRENYEFAKKEKFLLREEYFILGRFVEAVKQILAAVKEILRQTRTDSLSLIAHPMGTLPASGFAASYPNLIDRLILFGPIARRYKPAPDTTVSPTRAITSQCQYDRFIAYVPGGASSVLSDAHFAEWGQAYLNSDSVSQTLSPPAVTVPSGPAADIAEVRSGQFPYEPSKVLCPVLLVRGEWDSVIPDADAAWLYNAFSNAADKQDIKLARAPHLAHLESGRIRLYEAIRHFLNAEPEKALNANSQVALIFEAKLADGRKDEYLDIAAEMSPMLNQVDGFISVNRFQSQTDPRNLLSLSFFEDEAEVAQWRTLNAHRVAQVRGRLVFLLTTAFG